MMLDAHDWSMTTEQILSSCGDSRHTVGPDGTNRYGNRYAPEPGLLSFGSCTSSTISDVAFEAADRLHGWVRALDPEAVEQSVDDLYERVRTELVANIAMTSASALDVVVCPSGTDAELVPLLVALAEGRRVTTVLVGASEAGSGTAHAARGHHFDAVTPSGRGVEPGTPVDGDVADRVGLERVTIRDGAGVPREEKEIDDEVRAIVGAAAARGEHVLLHIIAHSKTGVHAPSLELVDALVHAHPGQVDVVIDAAQGRFSRQGLLRSLQRGYMVMVTGSKFFGGPPFAGAVLVPHERAGGRAVPAEVPEPFGDYLVRAMLPRTWTGARASVAPGLALGVLMRWWAALAEIRDYYSVPATLRLEVLRTFQSVVPEIVAGTRHLDLSTVPPPNRCRDATRLLESNTTVFPFTCRTDDGHLLGMEPLRALARAVRYGSVDDERLRPDLAALRCELGQPVELAGGGESFAVLRVALGGRDIIRACVTPSLGSTFAERREHLARDVALTLEKVDALVALAHTDALEGAR
ncbi:hypothetical protein KC207_09410 [Phycicoccus sp. BSK3Z-2]|uniref:Uncharacterized protein n=1 Tax=Phycicoccus avicenniae TaxID=2828860 RepID=A0A941D7G4_9MICO|nr:hypothetical protein [Phycicoccus avicenniae]MBR7743504.1 hypothetical protein [Phycicoccus avicenniae]